MGCPIIVPEKIRLHIENILIFDIEANLKQLDSETSTRIREELTPLLKPINTILQNIKNKKQENVSKMPNVQY